MTKLQTVVKPNHPPSLSRVWATYMAREDDTLGWAGSPQTSHGNLKKHSEIWVIWWHFLSKFAPFSGFISPSLSSSASSLWAHHFALHSEKVGTIRLSFSSTESPRLPASTPILSLAFCWSGNVPITFEKRWVGEHMSGYAPLLDFGQLYLCRSPFFSRNIKSPFLVHHFHQ